MNEIRIIGVYLDKNRYIEKKRKKRLHLKTVGLVTSNEIKALIKRFSTFTGVSAIPRSFTFESAAHVQAGVLVEHNIQEDIQFAPEIEENMGTSCIMLTYIEHVPQDVSPMELVSAMASKRPTATARRVRFGLHRNKIGRANTTPKRKIVSWK